MSHATVLIRLYSGTALGLGAIACAIAYSFDRMPLPMAVLLALAAWFTMPPLGDADATIDAMRDEMDRRDKASKPDG